MAAIRTRHYLKHFAMLSPQSSAACWTGRGASERPPIFMPLLSSGPPLPSRVCAQQQHATPCRTAEQTCRVHCGDFALRPLSLPHSTVHIHSPSKPLSLARFPLPFRPRDSGSLALCICPGMANQAAAPRTTTRRRRRTSVAASFPCRPSSPQPSQPPFLFICPRCPPALQVIRPSD